MRSFRRGHAICLRGDAAQPHRAARRRDPAPRPRPLRQDSRPHGRPHRPWKSRRPAHRQSAPPRTPDGLAHGLDGPEAVNRVGRPVNRAVLAEPVQEPRSTSRHGPAAPHPERRHGFCDQRKEENDWRVDGDAERRRGAAPGSGARGPPPAHSADPQAPVHPGEGHRFLRRRARGRLRIPAPAARARRRQRSDRRGTRRRRAALPAARLGHLPGGTRRVHDLLRA